MTAILKNQIKDESKKLNKYLIYNSLASPWLKNIRDCQNEIASLNPHPHYLESYRNDEIYFWRHIPEWITKDFSKGEIDRALDIGSAYGTLALYCKKMFDCDVYTVDFMETYLSPSLIKKYNFHFNQKNVELDDLPFEFKFDVILFTEILEHLNFNPVPTLKKIRGLLSEKGKLYLSTPDAAKWGKVTKYYTKIDDIPPPQKGMPVVDDHVYQYNKDELLGIIEAAELKVYRFDYSPGVARRHFNLTLTK